MSRNRPSASTHNYAGQDLRNRSFKGQDLRGADFSYAQLQGCNFENADLTGASFAHAKAGQSRRQRVIFITSAIALTPVFALALSCSSPIEAAGSIEVAVIVLIAVAGSIAGSVVIVSRAIAAFARGGVSEGTVLSIISLMLICCALYNLSNGLHTTCKYFI